MNATEQIPHVQEIIPPKQSLVIHQNDCDISEYEPLGNASKGPGDPSGLSDLNSSPSHKLEVSSPLIPSPKGGFTPHILPKGRVPNFCDAEQTTIQTEKCPGVHFASGSQQLADEARVSKDLSSPKEDETHIREGTDFIESATSEAVTNKKGDNGQEIKIEVTDEGDGSELPKQRKWLRIRKTPRRRRSLFGYRRKPEELPVRPNHGPKRYRRKVVFFVYEPIPDGSEGGVKAEESQSTSTDCQQSPVQDSPSTTAVSGRSSRIIKTPKRFMDDADMSCLPHSRIHLKKSPFSLHSRSMRKNEDGSLGDVYSFWDYEDALGKPIFKYKDIDMSQTMETYCEYGKERVEGDTADGNSCSLKPTDLIKREDYSLNLGYGEPIQDQIENREQVTVEEKGTTHRISLSCANKKMFHLLKRAKVQLIKIDQEKQLKTSQLLSGSVGVGSQDRGSLKLKRRVVQTSNNFLPQELHWCAPLGSSMMQGEVWLEQDTETTLPELTEQHRIRQKEEELGGLESGVHMPEPETVCAAPGLNTLEPECVTANSGVSDVHHTHTSLIETEMDLGSIKTESLDSTELGYVAHLHPDQIKTEPDDGGYLQAENLQVFDDVDFTSDPIKIESSECSVNDLMNTVMNEADIGHEYKTEPWQYAGELSPNCIKEEMHDFPIHCADLLHHCDKNNE